LGGTGPTGGVVLGGVVLGGTLPGVAALGGPFLWRVAASSRSAAAARCSVRGRDTSRARIAEVGVIFIPAMDPLSPY
jgi:hypothetical protein